MTQPGSDSYDLQKQELRKGLEDQGVDDETAEEVADDAMKRKPRPVTRRCARSFRPRQIRERTLPARRIASPTDQPTRWE
jgi:hypothetical protein